MDGCRVGDGLCAALASTSVCDPPLIAAAVKALLRPLPSSALQEEFFIKFAEFEEKVREVERARAIYRYSLDHIPKVCTRAERRLEVEGALCVL